MRRPTAPRQAIPIPRMACSAECPCKSVVPFQRCQTQSPGSTAAFPPGPNCGAATTAPKCRRDRIAFSTYALFSASAGGGVIRVTSTPRSNAARMSGSTVGHRYSPKNGTSPTTLSEASLRSVPNRSKLLPSASVARISVLKVNPTTSDTRTIWRRCSIPITRK